LVTSSPNAISCARYCQQLQQPQLSGEKAAAAVVAATVGRGSNSSSSNSSRAVMKAHQEEMDGALALGGCHLATTHNNQL